MTEGGYTFTVAKRLNITPFLGLGFILSEKVQETNNLTGEKTHYQGGHTYNFDTGIRFNFLF